MSEHDSPDPLKAFGERLDKARRAREVAPADDGKDAGLPSGALGLAFRIGVELVAALIVGLGIGWLLDQWLGTRPWGMVLFFFLGAAAGILNVYRAVTGIGYAVGYRRPGQDSRVGQRKADED
jgi:ATP synthase protein I